MAKKEAEAPVRDPKTFKLKVTVGPTISLEDQCRLLGVEYVLDSSRLGEWPDKKAFKRPEMPYEICVQDGKDNVGKSFDKVRLAPNERRPSALEGLAVFPKTPDILDDHGLILTGTTVGPYDVVILHKVKGKIRMEPYSVTFVDEKAGIVTCSR